MPIGNLAFFLHHATVVLGDDGGVVAAQFPRAAAWSSIQEVLT
jgi:hypothetical protein